MLKNVSLDIAARAVTAIIGPSGCGKSTFLRALNRMHELNPEARMEGEIRLFGDDIYARDVEPVVVRRRVGMVFQKSNPFPTMSIAENVTVGLRLNGVRDRKLLAERTEQSLRMAALWDEVKDRLHAPAISLSGGQQQRLCIARALAVQPEVLLMDEPASALDPLATPKIEDLILELKKDYTIVIVTHNMQQAARASDFTAFFYLGELVEFGPTTKIFTNPVAKAHGRLRDRAVRLMSMQSCQIDRIMDNHFEDGTWTILTAETAVMASHAETAVNEAVQALDRSATTTSPCRSGKTTTSLTSLKWRLTNWPSNCSPRRRWPPICGSVTVAMKISQNLERIGDEATKIAKRARDLSQEPPVKINLDLPRMAGMALDMVKDALDAFVQPRFRRRPRHHPARQGGGRAQQARCTQPWRSTWWKIPTPSRRCLHWMVAAKSLERIADHAKNIAEEVVYLCEAQDIRHAGARGQGAPAPVPGA